MSTLLEVCPAAASDEQSVPSKCHALIPWHQHHTPISVSRCLSHCQILEGRRNKGELKAYKKHFIKQLQLKNWSSLQSNRWYRCKMQYPKWKVYMGVSVYITELKESQIKTQDAEKTYDTTVYILTHWYIHEISNMFFLHVFQRWSCLPLTERYLQRHHWIWRLHSSARPIFSSSAQCLWCGPHGSACSLSGNENNRVDDMHIIFYKLLLNFKWMTASKF